MAGTFELVGQLNAEARRAGIADTIAQFDNVVTHAQYRTVYELTMRYVRAGDRALDWGCGNGHYSVFLDSLGARITGYSFEPKPASMRHSANFEFVPGSEVDPRTLPFDSATFDVAMSVGVLEHVWETGGDEASSLAELARVLKPGGVLLTFHLPNETGWVERIVHALRLKIHFHKRKFTANEIRRLWNDAGFDIVELGLYNALPRAQFRALPGFLKHNRLLARTYGAIDDLVTRAAPNVCTNFYIAARKRG